LSDSEEPAAAGGPAERPALDRPGEGKPEQDAPANRGPADPPAGTGSGRWDGNAARVPLVDGARSAAPDGEEPADPQDEWLTNDKKTDRMRADIPAGSSFRDAVFGEVHYHYYQSRQERRGPGRVPVRDLVRASHVHVAMRSDTDLRELLEQHQVVFCRGMPGTGRNQSATVVLDRLTGYDRSASKIIELDTTSGPDGLAGQLEAGCGHVLDGSDVPWAETLSRAQVNRFRAALGTSGFLVILVGADDGMPLAGPAVNHVGPAGPELGEVAVYHLAVRLLDGELPADQGNLTQARAEARTVITAARQADDKTRDWFEELTRAGAVGPAEAVLFADVVADWHRRRQFDPSARPRVAEARARLRYEQAARLLRRSDVTDSPVRQSFALSAAVLDGLALSEVIDGAAQLATLLFEVERPGKPGKRVVFAQPFVHWLRHVEMASPKPKRDDRDGAVLVNMPSRELARAVIELAWCEYDAARIPVLNWLMALAADHTDARVNVRAVQALAYIAAHDYPLIKQRVLDVWSKAGGRNVERLAAALLLEAMVLDGAVTDEVAKLLRRWSRAEAGWSRAEIGKLTVAVRAYATAIASRMPGDAIEGVRIAAVLPVGLGTLPEAALGEMYRLGLTKEVTEELPKWRHGFPAMRQRAGKALVRIAELRLTTEGEPDAPYDLLWRLVYEPDTVGASIAELAELWLLACSDEDEPSRNLAWRRLGHWAQSCRRYRGLGRTFNNLAEEFEKAAGSDDLRGRLSVYRRRWNSFTKEEEKMDSFTKADEETDSFTKANEETDRFSKADEETDSFTKANEETDSFTKANEETDRFSKANEEMHRFTKEEGEMDR